MLSFSSKQVRKLSKYLMKYQLPQDKFPMRAKIPLFFFMEATFHFENLAFTRPSEVEGAIKLRKDSCRQFKQFPVVIVDAQTVFQIDRKVEQLRRA